MQSRNGTHFICVAIYQGKWTPTIQCLLPYFEQKHEKNCVAFGNTT